MRSSISLVKSAEGLHSLDSLCRIWNVKSSTAINYLAKLRKEGYAATKGGGKQKRLYKITPYKKVEVGNEGFYDVLNKYSKIKIRPPYKEEVVGRKYSVEDVLIRAIQSHDYRLILAALDLFRHVTNWSKLYGLAKKNGCIKKIGALYALAKTIVRVKRIDKRILNQMLASEKESPYIVPQVRSKDYKELEKLWQVYIPFNKKDLERYKE